MSGIDSSGVDGKTQVLTVDAAPISSGERIMALDVLRGVAVLGILLMNITAFGLPWPAYNDPSIWGGDTGANLWAWITTEMFFEGTMRTIFSMLFGVGVIVFTTRAEKKNPASAADLFYRRTILLILFGVIHAYIMLWPGDILYAYGIAGLFLFPMRRVSGKKLIILGIGLLVITGTLFNALDEVGYRSAKSEGVAAMTLRDAGEELTHEQVEAIKEWEEATEDHAPSAEVLEDKIEAFRGTYAESFAHLAPINIYVQSSGYYTWMFWDVISMMLIGMGLVKLGVVTGERSLRAYTAMVIIGYGVGFSVNAYETMHIIRGEFSAESFFESWRTYNIGRLFVALGHIGLVMLLVRVGFLSWLIRALGAAGRMALTNYLAQTVICNIVFLGVGFGLFGKLDRAELYIVVGSVWLVQLIWSPLWLKQFRFGPAEWLWRSMTYGRLQAMRK